MTHIICVTFLSVNTWNSAGTFLVQRNGRQNMVRRDTGAHGGGEEKEKPSAKRPPTSGDVARLANVSQSTVSLVLNNVGDNRFSEETRRRVLEAAEQLGYVPHA